MRKANQVFASFAGDPAKAELPDWQQRRVFSRSAVGHLAPIVVEFIHGLVLREPDVAMNRFGRQMNFRGRFAPHAEPDLLATLGSQFEYLVTAGFGLHHLLTDFPGREFVAATNILDLQQEWLPRTLIASHSLRQYDRDQQGIPSRLAEYLYRTRIDGPVREGLRLRFWKVGHAQFSIKNLFWAGMLLALGADLQAQRLSLNRVE